MKKKITLSAVVTYPSLEGVGKLGKVAPGDSPGALTNILSRLVGFLTVIGVIYFTIQIILTAYNWISAGGDAQKIKTAQDKLWQSFLGLGILLIAVALVSIVGFFFGVDFLNLETIIKGLSP